MDVVMISLSIHVMTSQCLSINRLSHSEENWCPCKISVRNITVVGLSWDDIWLFTAVNTSALNVESVFKANCLSPFVRQNSHFSATQTFTRRWHRPATHAAAPVCITDVAGTGTLLGHSRLRCDDLFHILIPWLFILAILGLKHVQLNKPATNMFYEFVFIAAFAVTIARHNNFCQIVQWVTSEFE